MEFFCAVSLGEILDKISVLRIKKTRIHDVSKLNYIIAELNRLTEQLGDTVQYESYLEELTRYNNIIWDVEDQLRLKEKQHCFDGEFIELARQAYLTNDKRFAVKDAANQRFNSAVREQKSHAT